MAQLTDPDRLDAYTDALGNWQHRYYVDFELTESAYRWIRENLDGVTLDGLKRLMFEYVEQGGEIDEQPETRPEWSEYEFHFDLRFEVKGVPTYCETRLHYRLPVRPDESSITVVNVHAP
ncbi:hypothetical protein ACFL2H_06860 [Planctomycetota bacterium]